MITIAVTVRVGQTSKDVALSYDENETCGPLIEALLDAAGRSGNSDAIRVLRTGEEIDATSSANNLDLLHGDIIDVAPLSTTQTSAYLERVGDVGPVIISLPEADLPLGRDGSASRIALDDPTVSRLHATITRRGSAVTIRDEGSSNGTFVNGVRLTGTHALASGDVVEFGERSRYRLMGIQQTVHLEGPHLDRAEGRLRFNRPPRQLISRPDEVREIGPAPETPRTRRIPIPMMVLPLIAAGAGFGITAATGSGDPPYAILSFALLGPLMAGWNWYDDRRSGRGDFVAASKRHEQMLNDTEAALAAQQAALHGWREWSTPTTSQLLRLAERRAAEVWDRQPTHDDFLALRIGTGDLAAPSRVKVSQQGNAEQVQRALAIQQNYSIDPRTPVSWSLVSDAVAGVFGSGEEARRAVGRALAVQIAVRHSPNDVVVACLAQADWQWLSWIPHCTPDDEVLPLVGTDADTRERVLTWLENLVAQRAGRANTYTAPFPYRVVLVIEQPLDLQAHRINAVISAAPACGISVVVLAPDRSNLPTSTSVIVEVGATPTIRRTVGEPPIALTAIEGVSRSEAEAAARALAPLVDPGTSTSAAVPDRVGLFDILGREVLEAGRLRQRWANGTLDLAAGRLAGAIGQTGNGVLELDLGNDGDGPHGLVGGSPGTGKSEFLQTLVLSLASNYSPDQLNFLFIDFKGGLTFRDLVRLPHAVGMVRNLDGSLALRAKRSLQAETRRRQQILHRHGAVNLAELRRRAPEEVLPALVLIVDEFAELAQKLPEFLDSIVEIAQTGRALGIHLLLATQSPGNSVSRNIQNCSKYRISFRLTDSSASTEVLGKGRDASLLPNHPGRALMLDGSGRIHEFQSAWAGGQTELDDTGGASAVTLFRPRSGNRTSGTTPTDMERVIDAIVSTFDSTGADAPRRPWVEPLPPLVPAMQLWEHASVDATKVERSISIGLADLPDQQLRAAYEWNLAQTQNLLVVGDGSSGKTTTLRTIAGAFAHAYGSDDVLLLGIDAVSSGLASIETLPNCVAVVNAMDTAQLRRVFAYLRRQIAERRDLVGSAGSLRTHRQHTGERVADIVVLVDGLEHVLSYLETLDGGAHQAALAQVIAEGPSMGVHFALTTEQPQRLPMSIANAVPERLLLRMRSREAGFAADTKADLSGLANGRAISARTDDEVQIATLGVDEGGTFHTDAVAQQTALHRLSEELAGDGRHRAAPLAEPPEVLTPDLLRRIGWSPSPNQVVLGVDDLFVLPLGLDFHAVPTLVVAGPDLSGRTNALEWIRIALEAGGPLRSIYLSGRGDAPRRGGWSNAFTDTAASLDVLEQLATERADARRTGIDTLLVLDDADDLIESAPIGLSPDETQVNRRFNTAMDTIVRAGRNAGVAVVIAGRMTTLTRASGWALRMRQNQQAVLLAPPTLNGISTDYIFNVQLPRRSEFTPQPGHGVLVRRGTTDVIQLVYAGNAEG